MRRFAAANSFLWKSALRGAAAPMTAIPNHNTALDMTVDDADETLCHCRGLQRGAVRRAIQAQGLHGLQEVGRCLGAGTDCGSCVPELRELLGQAAWFDVRVRRRPLSADPADPRAIHELVLELPAGVSYPPSRSGQHISLQGWIDGLWVTRSYTLVRPGPCDGTLHIAVRRQPGGRFTPWLLDGPLPTLRVSEPLGADLWAGRPQPTVVLAGGIGITLALSMLAQRPRGSPLHLVYRTRSLADQVYVPELNEASALDPKFSLTLQTDEASGLLQAAQVAALARQHRGARFVVCGPPAFEQVVVQGLQQAGVPARQVQVEHFHKALRTAAASRQGPGWKRMGYRLGAVGALLPALVLLPAFQPYLPHQRHNTGHEELACADCHRAAPGSLRQQLQGKLDHWRGRRETPVDFGQARVDNRVCQGCHVRAQDRHPPHRFLEPRFAPVRESLAPQLCVSCHREHQAARVTLADPGFCATCHADLKLQRERVEPSHETLIAQSRWDSCLGCHDFHGNHTQAEPLRLQEAVAPAALQRYFAGGPSPYGAVKEAALRQPAAASSTPRSTP